VRPVAKALAVVAIGAAASGCGDGSSKPRTPTKRASHPITKAQAVAFTRAVTLRAGDLPLATLNRSTGDAQTRELSRKARACLRQAGEVKPELALAGRESKSFEWHLHGESAGLSSTVTVMPRVGLVARNNAVDRSRRAIHCVAEVLSSALLEAIGGRAEINAVVESRLPFPLPRVHSGFGWRIAISMMLGQHERAQLIDYTGQELRHIQVYFDVLGFTSGPAEVGVLAYGVPAPVPKWMEDSAIGLLYARAATHRL